MLALLLAACGSDPQGADADVTWHRDVAPLLADRCGACHQDGGIAPFSVETYDDASAWGEAMVDSVEAGRMPPFFATETDECAPRLGFLDDLRLSDEEQQLLADWVADGMPEGDPASAAPAPLREVARLENPDATLTLPQPFTVDGDRDIYRCFRVEVDNPSDVWITGLEVIPDNELVVHHVLVWNDPEDQSAGKVGPDGSYPCSGDPGLWPTELVAAWTPGGSPMQAPAGTGTLFKPGASLVVNVHYHPTGTTTEVDQSSIALKWTTEQPPNHSTWYLVDIPFGAQVVPDDRGDSQFRIPARTQGHVETVALEIPDLIPWDLPVFAITPHMHYLGTDMLVTVRRPELGDECLIHTPGYRFDFQASYLYDASDGALPVLHPGDTVEVRCTYDNTNADDAYWGENTTDEMCMAMVGLIIPPVDWLELAGSLF